MWEVVLKSTLGVLTLLAAALLFTYFCFPKAVVRLFFKLQRLMCGIQVKFIGNADVIFCYGEIGKPSKDKSSILFIHGYTANKDQWMLTIKVLGRGHHIITVDMPGHGATSVPPPEQDLTIEFAMESMKLFADMVGLTEKPFHIVGASLGGCLAGLFAAAYPHLVERVTLISPGMKTPESSEFAKELDKVILEIGSENLQIEHCMMLPQTTQELQFMIDSCIHNDATFSTQILKGILQLRTSRNEFFLRVFRIITTEQNMTVLENNCHRITMPSQVIWGENDKILHISGAELLEKKLPNCQDLTVIKGCGHCVEVDRPGTLAKALLKFRGELPKHRH